MYCPLQCENWWSSNSRYQHLSTNKTCYYQQVTMYTNHDLTEWSNRSGFANALEFSRTTVSRVYRHYVYYRKTISTRPLCPSTSFTRSWTSSLVRNQTLQELNCLPQYWCLKYDRRELIHNIFVCFKTLCIGKHPIRFEDVIYIAHPVQVNFPSRFRWALQTR